MFQYAMARTLADRTGTDVVLNTKLGFVRDHDFQRQYALFPFRLRYRKNKLLSFDFPGGDWIEKISRRLGFHLFCPWYRYVYNTVHPEELIRNSSNYRRVILSGYFVNLNYFVDGIDRIRSDFRLNRELPPSVMYYIEKIEKSKKPVVMIGVRLYQEIKDAELRKKGFFYVDADFYNRAMAYCVEKYGDALFLIFTQGKQWVEDNVCIDRYDYEFVETGASDTTAYYDLAIMSKCQCYIISNSTYYWWGTMLNASPREVIVPKKWTNSTLPEWTKL